LSIVVKFSFNKRFPSGVGWPRAFLQTPDSYEFFAYNPDCSANPYLLVEAVVLFVYPTVSRYSLTGTDK
jgi:hypothetical protein